MNCKKGMATFLALAVAANATGAPVHAEGKSFLERIETLERANWTMVPWRNVLNNLGDLPEDIDKLDEFLLQDEYFDGNLTLAEKIFNAPKRHVAKNEGYNETLLAQEFAGYEADVCMSDEAVHDYKQQVAELLEGSWLDLVNGTDLMLHMKDGRVFNCADLLPAGLCKDLIRTFTEEGREAAERELREGIIAIIVGSVILGGAILAKLIFDKGTTPKPGPGPDGGDGGAGSGGGGGSGSDDNDEEHRKKALETAKQNGEKKLKELEAAINAAEGKGGDKLTAANDLKNDLTNALKGTDAKAITDAASKVDNVVMALNAAVEEAKEQEEKEKRESEEEQKRKEEEERKAQEALRAAKQKGQTKLTELTNAINVAGDKGGDALENANALKTELTNALDGTDAQAITGAADKVDGVVEALNKAVKEAKEQEEKEKRESEEERLKKDLTDALVDLRRAIDEARASGVANEALKEAEILLSTATVLINNGDASVIREQLLVVRDKTSELKDFISVLSNKPPFTPTQNSTVTWEIGNSLLIESSANFSFGLPPQQLQSKYGIGIDSQNTQSKEIKEIKEEEKEEEKEEVVAPNVAEEQQQQQVEPAVEVEQPKKQENPEENHQPMDDQHAPQVVNVEQQIEMPLDTDGRVKAAQAALQAAQEDSKNKVLINEKRELVKSLIQEYRQCLQRQAISNDKILEKLRFIYAKLEEMLKELKEQPKEDKEEPKEDGDDNKGGQGGQGGQGNGNGNGMEENKEQKEDKKDDEMQDEAQEDKQNADPKDLNNKENNEEHSHVGLAYVGNVVKNIPGCLFTKENLEAAAVTGLAAAASGTPAAIPAAGVAAIGYNTLKCAQDKANAQRPVLKLKSWETKQREARDKEYAEVMEKLQMERDSRLKEVQDVFIRENNMEVF